MLTDYKLVRVIQNATGQPTQLVVRQYEGDVTTAPDVPGGPDITRYRRTGVVRTVTVDVREKWLTRLPADWIAGLNELLAAAAGGRTPIAPQTLTDEQRARLQELGR